MAELRQDMVIFWRKLGRLLDGGVPLLRALRVIEEETERADLRDTLQGLPRAIEAGRTFSEALEQVPQFFPLSARTMVRTGELTGRLDQVCLEVAKGFEDGTFVAGVVPAGSALADPTGDGTEEAPVAKYVDLLVAQSVKDGASDLHFESGEDGRHRIRYRVDGVLHEMAPLPSHLFPEAVNRVKIMAGLNIAEKRLPQDGRIQTTLDGKGFDLRVSTIPCIWGENVCIRFMPAKADLLPLAEQGFTASQLSTLRDWLHRPNGLILVTGAVACGKTTTLYSMVQELNDPGAKVLTIEDPVECPIPGTNQMRVRADVGLTFAHCLRATFRQDPDVIMVGDIRDRDTVQMITQAVLTGRLVLSSLHTNDACGAVVRLLDIGIEPFLVNATLTGVCAQRLVRRICPACRQEAAPKAAAASVVAAHPGLKLYEGRGCDRCRHTGYRGRIAIHELLEMDDALRSRVAAGADPHAFKEQAIRSGMVTLREDGLAKVHEGLTTLDEVLRVCAGA